jgi:hypothetical protein
LGVVGSGIYAWGANLVEGATHVSSYVKTTSAPVTRESDVLTFPWPALQPMTDFTTHVQLARPAWADATGTLSHFPGFLSIGSAIGVTRPRFELYSSNAVRNLTSTIVDLLSTTGTVTAAIPATATVDLTTQANSLTTGPRLRHDPGSGFGAYGAVLAPWHDWSANVVAVGHLGSNPGHGADANILRVKIAAGARTRAEMLAL